MNKITSRTVRADMPRLLATVIHGVDGSGQGHRSLCRTDCEAGAADQATRIIGETHDAPGFDIHGSGRPSLPGHACVSALGGHRADWSTEAWSSLIAAQHASEQAASERRSAEC